MSVEDRVLVNELIDSDPNLTSNAEFISPVGLVSIFPHRSSLKIFGLILSVFSRERLPLYGLASSISTLTCITDYARLDQAVTAIQEYIDVPIDQSRLKPEIHVKQSQDIRT